MPVTRRRYPPCSEHRTSRWQRATLTFPAVTALTVTALACQPSDARELELASVETLPSPAGDRSGEPNLATGPDGRIYLSWLEAAGDSAHTLRFAMLDDSGWSEPRTIATGSNWFVNWADFPSIVALPDGRLAAHWLERNAEGTYTYDVRITQSADGGATWSEPVTPHRDGTSSEHGFVSFYAAGGDSLGVVWLDGRKYAGKGTKEMQLAQTTIAPDGSLGEERILDTRICDCCQTSAARIPDGLAVVYRDRSADEIRDISIIRNVNGHWTEPALVHADGWHIAACPVNGPAIAARGNSVVVAWFTGAGDTARVRVAFSDDAGATFGAPIRVDEGTPAGRVDVALGGRVDDPATPEAGAIVTWVERTGGENAEVLARRVMSNGSLGDALTVTASSAARASGFPQMVRTDDAVVFAWTAPTEPARVRTARVVLRDQP
ncbi:MAG: sialidase family protein [Gemmatimonadaceae bacterium]